VLGPKELDYEEGQPIPAGYHLDSKIRKGLFIGGTVTFGACYLLSALSASVADSGNNDEFAPLFVPVAGPFITIGTANAEGAGTFWLVVDGVAQAGGLVMAIAGLVAQEELLVRNDVGKPKITVSPFYAGNGSFGLGVAGAM
jgi:hypothetical protein